MPGLSDAIGELFIKIKPDTSTFGAETSAGVAAQSAGARGAGSKSGKLVGGAMAVAAGAAFARGISDSTEFDRGLNEVFTLIPGAGADAFSSLEQQTKDFAKEFGVLPNDVIPALYDSLSAGVPQDNVFQFLEDANEFAKAGAVDLSTSVDGLTTGLNAYSLGADQAGRVSDALFTGVKLGKTTVEELSNSLFQVAPIANVVGVDIEQVSASLATLTAQGTPTKVAATQMKAAMTELARDGTKASKAFEELAGESFVDFIAGGGDVVEAAALMSEGAKENGQSLLDMFGSVEGGQAFIGLASDLDKSRANLEAVNDATGATTEAFDQMEQGIGPIMDKMSATISVAFLEIGAAMAPTLEAVLPVIAEFLSIIADLPGPVLVLGLAVLGFSGAMLLLAGPILKVIKLMQLLRLTALANPWVLLAAATVALGILIFKNWDEISEFLGDTWEWLSDTASDVADSIEAAWDGLFVAVEFMVNNFVLFWNALWTGFTEDEGTRIEEFALRIRDIFQGMFDGIIAAWDSWWNIMSSGIGAFTAAWDAAWGAAASVVDQASRLIDGAIDLALAPVRGLQDGVELMSAAWSTAWGGVTSATQTAADIIIGAVDSVKSAVDGALGPVGDFVGFAGSTAGKGLNLLGFDDGGTVPGPKGSPQMILAHGGETILPTHKDPSAGAGMGGLTVNLNGATIRDDRDVTMLARELWREQERANKARGN